MKIVDANILLYSVNEESVFQERARTWISSTVEEGETLGLTWIVIVAFLRLSTSPRAFPQPLPFAQAQGFVGDWVSHPQTTIVNPMRSHWETMSRLLTTTETFPNLTNDAHLAALAIDHQATIVSADRDFSRFPEAMWINPFEEV